MGFQETETTAYSNDKGVDVRGVLNVDQLSKVKIAVQAKRWTNNVGSVTVRNLSGSLKVADSEQGVVITPGDFTPEAKTEAQASGKTSISLINGEQLVDLLFRYQVGFKQEQYTVPSLDEEYWSEVLGVSVSEPPLAAAKATGIPETIHLHNVGQHAQSRAILHAYPQKDPKNIEAFLWLAKVSPDTREAIAAAELALALQPQNEIAHQAVAAVHKRLPDSQKIAG